MYKDNVRIIAISLGLFCAGAVCMSIVSGLQKNDEPLYKTSDGKAPVRAVSTVNSTVNLTDVSHVSHVSHVSEVSDAYDIHSKPVGNSSYVPDVSQRHVMSHIFIDNAFKNRVESSVQDESEISVIESAQIETEDEISVLSELSYESSISEEILQSSNIDEEVIDVMSEESSKISYQDVSDVFVSELEESSEESSVYDSSIVSESVSDDIWYECDDKAVYFQDKVYYEVPAFMDMINRNREDSGMNTLSWVTKDVLFDHYLKKMNDDSEYAEYLKTNYPEYFTQTGDFNYDICIAELSSCLQSDIMTLYFNVDNDYVYSHTDDIKIVYLGVSDDEDSYMNEVSDVINMFTGDESAQYIYAVIYDGCMQICFYTDEDLDRFM